MDSITIINKSLSKSSKVHYEPDQTIDQLAQQVGALWNVFPECLIFKHNGHYSHLYETVIEFGIKVGDTVTCIYENFSELYPRAGETVQILKDMKWTDL